MPILTDIELDEISLVDKGANPGAEIVFYKRKAKAMNPEEILAAMPEDERSTMVELIASLKAQIPAEEEKTEAEEEAKEGEPEEEEKAEGEPEEEAKEGEEEEEAKNLGDPEDPKAKRASVAKRLAEHKELKKRVLQLEDEAQTAKLAKRVDAELPYLPGASRSDTVKLLKAASDGMSQSKFSALITMLKSCSEALSKSVMFSERGTGHVVAGSALEQINTVAKKLREDNPSLTMAKARLAASETNPELFSRYLAETRGA